MSDYVLTDDGLIYWPMCAIRTCKNRRCDALNSEYCWPHTGQNKAPGEIMWGPKKLLATHRDEG